MPTPADLTYNGYTSVILRHPNGQQALWVEDDYLSGRAGAPGTYYSINAESTRVPLDPAEDVDEIVALWKRHTDWDDGQS